IQCDVEGYLGFEGSLGVARVVRKRNADLVRKDLELHADGPVRSLVGGRATLGERLGARSWSQLGQAAQDVGNYFGRAEGQWGDGEPRLASKDAELGRADLRVRGEALDGGREDGYEQVRKGCGHGGLQTGLVVRRGKLDSGAFPRRAAERFRRVAGHSV